MTRRLAILLTGGVIAIAAAATGALLSLRGSTTPPTVSPTWGMFDDAQWNAIAARLPTFDSQALRVATAMSNRLALLTDGRCFALVRGAHVSAPICRLEKPVIAFSMRDGRFVDVVGLATKRVSTLVIDSDGRRQGGALIPAGRVNAFGFGAVGPVVLRALDGAAAVSTLYCASALRAVCGTSAQRRS